jgi:hypothetical protein
MLKFVENKTVENQENQENAINIIKQIRQDPNIFNALNPAGKEYLGRVAQRILEGKVMKEL